MGHSVGDGIIVAAIAAVIGAYLYFKHLERQRRLDIVHQERLAAMERGIPLPELPVDPPAAGRASDPRAPLLHGIVWTALGFGAMGALRLIPSQPIRDLWPLALPLGLLGVGLVLFYTLASPRSR